uniref:Uncharacterized protein n=1 Tax=Pseudomonas phage MK TaxID=3015287 RepID=A0AAT9TSF2_9VIRU
MALKQDKLKQKGDLKWHVLSRLPTSIPLTSSRPPNVPNVKSPANRVTIAKLAEAELSTSVAICKVCALPAGLNAGNPKPIRRVVLGFSTPSGDTKNGSSMRTLSRCSPCFLPCMVVRHAGVRRPARSKGHKTL